MYFFNREGRKEREEIRGKCCHPAHSFASRRCLGNRKTETCRPTFMQHADATSASRYFGARSRSVLRPSYAAFGRSSWLGRNTRVRSARSTGWGRALYRLGCCRRAPEMELCPCESEWRRIPVHLEDEPSRIGWRCASALASNQAGSRSIELRADEPPWARSGYLAIRGA
jgi:hypothetical protein